MIISTVERLAKKNPVMKFYKYLIFDSFLIVKEHGIKELFKRRGLKFVMIVIGYYTVRDTLLYIIIPLLIAKGLF